jgi:hypothetical protein
MLPARRGSSALFFDEIAYILRIGEDDEDAVAHHAGAQQRRPALRRALVAGVGFDAQVELPDGKRLNRSGIVGGSHS